MSGKLEDLESLDDLILFRTSPLQVIIGINVALTSTAFDRHQVRWMINGWENWGVL